MRLFLAASTALVVISASAFGTAQAASGTVRPSSFVESRQGNHPDGPDSIGRAAVSQDDALMCMLVEVYYATHKARTACVIKFQDGFQRTLNGGEVIQSPETGEFSLECRGRVPRRCMIEVNPPPTKTIPRPQAN